MNAAQNVFSSPELVTKTLKVQDIGAQRRLRLSTNFLAAMGWAADTRIQPVRVGDAIEIRRDLLGSHKVHQRAYRQRSNNPCETVIEFQDQALIRATIGVNHRFHVTMTADSIRLVGVPNRSAIIIDRFKRSRSWTAMAAMSGGLDILSLERAGFSVEALIEHRPQELRDKSARKEEVGALSAMALASPRRIFNESIYDFDASQLEHLFEEDPLVFAHFSPVCKGFSKCASESDKQRKIDNMESTLDMIVPVLNCIESAKPAALLVENVVPFGSSEACQILTLQLRRKGYFVTKMIIDPRDHGGVTSRKRCYLFASVFPGFEMSAPVAATESAWDITRRHLDSCRDVTNTSSAMKSISSGRGRYITEDKRCAPTILASQDRATKDAVRIKMADGRMLMPSVPLAAELMGVKDYPSDVLTSESSMEVLGNGVDVTSHEALMAAIKAHLEMNAPRRPVLRVANKKAH